MASYTVQTGDTLGGIAQKVGLGSNWQGLGYTGNPRNLQVGTVLNYGGSPASQPSQPSGTPAPSSSSSGSSYGDLVTNSSNQLNDLLSKQQQQYQGLVDQYKQQISSAPSYEQQYQTYATQAGLPTLQNGINVFNGQISNLGNQLANMSRTVGNANDEAGNGENAGQLQLQTQQQSIPLNNQLQALGLELTPMEQAYTTAQQNVQNQLQAYMQQQQLSLQPLQTQISALPGQFQNQIGAMTAEQQNQLAYAQQQAQLANALQVANVGAQAQVGAAGASAQSGALASNADYQNYVNKIGLYKKAGITGATALNAANGNPPPTVTPSVGGTPAMQSILQGSAGSYGIK